MVCLTGKSVTAKVLRRAVRGRELEQREILNALPSEKGPPQLVARGQLARCPEGI